MVDLDDTIIEVHGYQKQGAGFGYSGVRGLNALARDRVDDDSSAPVILGQRLRQGKTGSPKGAARIVGDALATLRRTGVAAGVSAVAAGGLRVLRPRHHRHRDQGRRGRVGHRSDGPRGEGRDRDHPR